MVKVTLMSSTPVFPQPSHDLDLNEIATALTSHGFYVMGYLAPDPERLPRPRDAASSEGATRLQ